MDRNDLLRIAEDFVNNSLDNYISRDIAISENVVGMKIYEAPILAYGAADDDYFVRLKEPSAIGEHFLLPKDWLPGAKTVISVFLPYSDAVKRGNRRDPLWPGEEWLHGRIEGQQFMDKLCRHLKEELINAGYSSIVPALAERFQSYKERPLPEASFTSNWSERHVAFVCGHGTFGLSKGLITKKGIAGRFGSIITELALSPDKREYEDLYEYCIMCGKCVKNCPVNAISLEHGKNHSICSRLIDETMIKFKPRYGCGKCQIKVPCENKIPKAIKSK